METIYHVQPPIHSILLEKGHCLLGMKLLTISAFCRTYLFSAVWAIKMDIQVFYKLSNIFLTIQKKWLNANKMKLISTGLQATNQKQKVREKILKGYSDATKSIITKIYSDESSGKASLRGTDKFRLDVLNQHYDCFVFQLCKSIDSYEQIAKRFTFLSGLMNNYNIDEDNVKRIIS